MSGFELFSRFAAAILCGYLLGGVPSGVLAGRAFGNVDPRAFGSGKTGATNVLRTLGPGPAALVVVGDIIKGALAVLLARYIYFDAVVGFPIHITAATARMLHVYQPWAEALAGLAAVLGHTYSVYIHFTGGRGVLTGAGAMVVMSPLSVLVGLIGAIVPISLTRYVSLGSILGAATVAITQLVLFLVNPRLFPLPHLLFAILGAGYIIVLHRDNIERLRSGTERKLGQAATRAR
jgi:acyl phosphate:glycerol-3-phosphate acyltransferase